MPSYTHSVASSVDAHHALVYARQRQQDVPALIKGAVWTSFGKTRLHAANPAVPSERALIDTVIEICERKQISPVPPIFIADTNVLNAASVSGQGIVYTAGIMKAMNSEQIAAITGHELSHHRHARRDTFTSLGLIIAGAAAGSMLFQSLASTALKSTLMPVKALGAVAGAISQSIIADYVFAMSAITPWRHYMELEADREGAQATSPASMKSALMRLDELSHKPHTQVGERSLIQRIVKTLAMPFPTHPSTDQRITRMEAMEHSR